MSRGFSPKEGRGVRGRIKQTTVISSCVISFGPNRIVLRHIVWAKNKGSDPNQRQHRRVLTSSMYELLGLGMGMSEGRDLLTVKDD